MSEWFPICITIFRHYKMLLTSWRHVYGLEVAHDEAYGVGGVDLDTVGGQGDQGADCQPFPMALGPQ